MLRKVYFGLHFYLVRLVILYVNNLYLKFIYLK
jgi:hypothetical protein